MPDSADVMLDQIDRLLRTKDYVWAKDTLTGIRRTVARTGEVTLRQQEAVEHIILGRLKHDIGPV